MRDPDRIDRMVEKVREVWKKYPDQRMGQLIMNMDRGEPNWPDIWNVEDIVLEEHLNEELEIPDGTSNSH